MRYQTGAHFSVAWFYRRLFHTGDPKLTMRVCIDFSLIQGSRIRERRNCKMKCCFQKADPLKKQNQSLFSFTFSSGASDAE